MFNNFMDLKGTQSKIKKNTVVELKSKQVKHGY